MTAQVAVDRQLNRSDITLSPTLQSRSNFGQIPGQKTPQNFDRGSFRAVDRRKLNLQTHHRRTPGLPQETFLSAFLQGSVDTPRRRAHGLPFKDPGRQIDRLPAPRPSNDDQDCRRVFQVCQPGFERRTKGPITPDDAPTLPLLGVAEFRPTPCRHFRQGLSDQHHLGSSLKGSDGQGLGAHVCRRRSQKDHKDEYDQAAQAGEKRFLLQRVGLNVSVGRSTRGLVKSCVFNHVGGMVPWLMSSRPNPNSPPAILASWLAAAGAGIFALGLLVGGQGLGALLGGCRWIGVTLPLNRQTWALVNQPSLAFASHVDALGYWLGGSAACLLGATLVIPLVPRPRGLASEFMAIQISWMAAVLGLGWMALLDPWDGHLSHVLRLHEMSPALAWVVPVLGAWAALIPTIRLLALVRGAQAQMGRSGRVLTVFIHLVLPACAWILVCLVVSTGTTSPGQKLFLQGIEGLWPPILASALPSIAALTLGWLAFPRAWVHHMEPIGVKSALGLLLTASILICLQVFLGGPMGPESNRGILWSHTNSRNNVRAWVRPKPVLGATVLPGILDDKNERE